MSEENVEAARQLIQAFIAGTWRLHDARAAGRFKSLAEKGQNYGVSELVPIVVAASALRVRVPSRAPGSAEG